MKLDKIIKIMLAVTLTLTLAGCAKCVGTSTLDTVVTVVDTEYVPTHTSLIPSGKVVIPIHHPAKHYVTFSFKDKEITVNDKGVYDKYYGRIGVPAVATIEAKTYDKGNKYKIVYEIVAVKEFEGEYLSDEDE